MKHTLTILALICAIVIATTSCTSNEDKVKERVRELASLLSGNNIAAEKIYPTLPLGTEVNSSLFTAPDIVVEKTEDGDYNVTMPEDATMLVSLTDDDKIVIKESHGILFCSPKQMKMALGTGWITMDMNDAEMAERFADKGFADWLGEKILEDVRNGLTCEIIGTYGDVYNEGEWIAADGILVKVKNRTNLLIPGNAYNIIGREWYWGNPNDKSSQTVNGVEVKPGEDAEIRVSVSPSMESDVDALVEYRNDVIIKLALENYEPKGGEYAQYKNKK